jgi:hypothetical protein
MFFLDPKRGRQRQARIRDKMTRISRQIGESRDIVTRDVQNRMQGLAAGDMTVLIGGKNALRGNPLRGSWSPAGRTMLGLIGGGLFLTGLTREAPTACILGTVGLGLMIEAASNAGIDDIAEIPTKVRKIAAKNFGHDGRETRRQEPTPRMAGIRS